MYSKTAPMPNYVQPRPLEQLDGAVGLTLHDMAKILGVTFQVVREKAKRPVFWKMVKHMNSLAKVYTLINDVTGLPFESIAMELSLAKMFIAKWDNEMGWSYLRYLGTCERIVEEMVPKLQASLAEKDRRIAALMAAKPKRSYTRRDPTVAVAVRKTLVRDLFGVLQPVEEEIRVHMSALTGLSRKVWKQKHLNSTMQGMMKATAQINEEIDKEGIAPAEVRAQKLTLVKNKK